MTAPSRFDPTAIKRDHPISEVIAGRGIALRRTGEGRFSAGVYPGGSGGFNAAFKVLSRQYVLPANGVANIGTDLGRRGLFLFASVSTQATAIYVFRGGNNAVAEVSDPDNGYLYA